MLHNVLAYANERMASDTTNISELTILRNFNEELNKIKITQNIGVWPALWQHQQKYQKSSAKNGSFQMQNMNMIANQTVKPSLGEQKLSFCTTYDQCLGCEDDIY